VNADLLNAHIAPVIVIAIILVRDKSNQWWTCVVNEKKNIGESKDDITPKVYAC